MNGLNYLLNGFRLIVKPGLKRYVFIPLLINIVLFIGLFFIANHFFNELNGWIIAHTPTWLRWIGSLLWLLFFLGFLMVALYLFVTCANLVSAPFNSLLAEKVEWFLTGKNIANQSILQAIADTPRIIARQFAILGYYLPRALLIVALFFIPVVQIIAPVVWFLFNAWYMTLQFIDYPTDNHRIPLNEVRLKLKQKRGLSFNFGASVLVCSMIPLLNLLVMPAAIAGATQLWLEEYAS